MIRRVGKRVGDDIRVSVLTGGAANDVVARQGYVYVAVAAEQSGLSVIDVTNPTVPVAVGN